MRFSFSIAGSASGEDEDCCALHANISRADFAGLSRSKYSCHIFDRISGGRKPKLPRPGWSGRAGESTGLSRAVDSRSFAIFRGRVCNQVIRSVEDEGRGGPKYPSTEWSNRRRTPVVGRYAGNF